MEGMEEKSPAPVIRAGLFWRLLSISSLKKLEIL